MKKNSNVETGIVVNTKNEKLSKKEIATVTPRECVADKNSEPPVNDKSTNNKTATHTPRAMAPPE